MKHLDVIIDTDIGSDIDDAYALALAMRSSLNILGISTVTGNTVTRGALAKKMLTIENKPGIPVFAGKASRAPLIYDQWVKKGESNEVNPDVESMVEFYWHAIEANPDGTLRIVGIGPLSNLAAIRERDPGMFDNRVTMVIMGGGIYKSYPGVLGLFPEYNIAMDKQAARQIFNSKVSLTIVPLDVTMVMRMEDRDLEILDARSGDDALIKGLVEMTKIFRTHWIGHCMPVLHDPATIATLLDDTLGKYSKLHLKITRGGYTRIMANVPQEDIEKRVCLEMDRQQFFDLFHHTLARHIPLVSQT